MKRYLAIAIIVCTLHACTKEEKVSSNDSIIETWQEFESYIDPGDGSGTFKPVDGITVSIKSDSSYVARSGSFPWDSTGTISLLNDSMIIIHRDQASYPVQAHFKLEGDVLQLNYSCIEGCGSRFRRVVVR